MAFIASFLITISILYFGIKGYEADTKPKAGILELGSSLIDIPEPKYHIIEHEDGFKIKIDDGYLISHTVEVDTSAGDEYLNLHSYFKEVFYLNFRGEEQICEKQFFKNSYDHETYLNLKYNHPKKIIKRDPISLSLIEYGLTIASEKNATLYPYEDIKKTQEIVNALNEDHKYDLPLEQLLRLNIVYEDNKSREAYFEKLSYSV